MEKVDKEHIEKMRILQIIRKNALNMNWKCMVDGCPEKTINSHLLQRHGVLDNIIEDGHMYELRVRDIFKWSKDVPPVVFKKVGLNDAISYPLFCNHHDTELFLDIEKNDPDVDAYRSQLLFSYRSVCAEMRKKEIEIDVNQRQLRSRILNLDSFYLKECIRGLEIGIKDLKFYEEQLLNEISTPKNLFTFEVAHFPFIPIYASASFSFETDKDKIESQNSVWDSAFIHILPRKSDLCIIIGYHKEYVNDRLKTFVGKWLHADKNTLGLLLTDLFSQRIEGFGMSEKLYQSMDEENIERFYEFQRKSIENYNMAFEPGFNLFEGEYWEKLWT